MGVAVGAGVGVAVGTVVGVAVGVGVGVAVGLVRTFVTGEGVGSSEQPARSMTLSIIQAPSQIVMDFDTFTSKALVGE